MSGFSARLSRISAESARLFGVHASGFFSPFDCFDCIWRAQDENLPISFLPTPPPRCSRLVIPRYSRTPEVCPFVAGVTRLLRARWEQLFGLELVSGDHLWKAHDLEQNDEAYVVSHWHMLHSFGCLETVGGTHYIHVHTSQRRDQGTLAPRGDSNTRQ